MKEEVIKSFIYFIVLISLLLPVYGFNLDLDLTKEDYSTNQSFEGILNIFGGGNLSSDKYVYGIVNGTNSSKIKLIEWLERGNNSFDFFEGHYNVDGEPWNNREILNGNSSKLLGFKLDSDVRRIESLNLTLDGNGGPLFIDIEDDGVIDWKYQGIRTGWNEEIYPNGFSESTIEDSIAGVRGNNRDRYCQDMIFDFNELYDELDLKIFVRAKKIIDGGDLKVNFDNYVCDVDDSLLNGDSFSKVSCQVKLNDVESGEHRLCVYSENGNAGTTYFEVPRKSNPIQSFYFITARTGKYYSILDGSFELYSENVNDRLDEGLGNCANECIIPIRAYLYGTGQISVTKVELIVNDNIKFINIYDAKKVEDFVSFDNISLELNDFYELRTASVTGDFDLTFLFDGKMSNKENFSIVELPVVVTDVSKSIARVNEEIEFDGSASYSKSGNITKYEWDFDDGNSDRGEKVTHSYDNFGVYNVSLTIEDLKGNKNKKVIIIKVGSLIDIIPSEINKTRLELINSKNYFSESSELIFDTYKLLGYDKIIKNSEDDLDKLSNEIENASENQLEQMMGIIEDIRSKVPSYLSLNTHEEHQFLNPNDIDESLFNSTKDKVFLFNSDVDVSVDSRDVSLRYLDGSENNFVLVKKIIDTSKSDFIVIEDLNNVGSDSITVLTKGYEKIGNALKWGESIDELLYIIKQGDLTDFGKTIIYSENAGGYECGDGRCEIGEDCSQDCKTVRIPWGIYGLLLGILILGVYYFNFYKGPGNFKNFANMLSVKTRKKRLFTDEQDLIKLRTYVNNTLRRGYNIQRIKLALKSRGWTEKQIKSAFNRRKKY